MIKPRLQFTVPVLSHGNTRRVKVLVYENLEDLYQAAETYGKRRGHQEIEREYHAITHSFEKFVLEEGGKESTFPNVCIIRYCLGYLHSYVIVHEVAHAALHIYQLDCVEETDPVFDHIDPGNETFCHIVSELEHNIVSKLHRMGAYD